MSTKPPPAGRAKVWKPFWKRFTDPRATDQADTIALHAQVHKAWKASIWAKPSALEGATNYFFERLNEYRPVPPYIRDRIKAAIRDVLSHETHIFASAEINWRAERLTLKEQFELRQFLRAQQRFLKNQDHTINLAGEIVLAAFAAIIDALPNIPEGTSTLTISLLEALQVAPGDIVERVSAVLMSQDLEDSGLFQQLRETIYINGCRVSGIWPFEETKKQITPASKSDLTPRELFFEYMQNTPFGHLLDIQFPFELPDVRAEHILMVAPTGSGKTQWIQQDIYSLITKPDPPGLVVIDSQNQMIPKLEKLRAARDRLVIIDPFDREPPALNMFIAPKRSYDENLKEVIETQILEQFAWVFSALDQDLSGRMNTLFTFTCRILLAMAPNANMMTLVQFLNIQKPLELTASRFWPYIERAGDEALQFFKGRFCTTDYNKTKTGVVDRLLGIMRIPAFTRMFNSSENRLDLYKELADRKLVVFNTQKGKLGPTASAVFGRYAISLYVRAAFEREADRDPSPAFLYIDEASEYFGRADSSDTLFTQLRKYNCGTFAAFQNVSQLKQQQDILLANTTTKFAGRVDLPGDAGTLAQIMRTDVEELLKTKKEQGRFEMLCYIKDHLQRAIRVSFPYGVVENAPQLTLQEHADLRAANRARYGSKTHERPSKPEPSLEPQAPRGNTTADVHRAQSKPPPRQHQSKDNASKPDPTPSHFVTGKDWEC